MRLLVHAIVRSEDVRQAEPIRDSNGGTFHFVSEGMLAAACSHTPAADTQPEVAQLLAYARGIHALFLRVTVLPMRYGCWLDNRQDLGRWLQRNEPALRERLQQVDGCVEMGVRILPIPSPAVETHDPPPTNAPKQPPSQTAASAGMNYLLGRQNRYARKDQVKDAFGQTTRYIQTALKGLFVQSVAQQHGPQHGRYWSLYFLVRRENCDQFRAAFGNLEDTIAEKLMLTGPWPPYNFANWKPSGLSS
jgi:putative lipoic acid-binding regulatory protein